MENASSGGLGVAALGRHLDCLLAPSLAALGSNPLIYDSVEVVSQVCSTNLLRLERAWVSRV